MSINFEDQVAIVTGAGNGLGRSYALELARRGARVVVNDIGGARDGSGGSLSPAQSVASEINENGGQAMANNTSVASRKDVDSMIEDVMQKWGRIDVLINNAGILRDRSFSKMSPADWDAAIDVHLNGAANCNQAVWNIMKQQNYGRILMTTSTSGLYGNFGQANYGAAKMAVIGLMNTLCIEGAKNGIRVNCLAPIATTRMTADILTKDAQSALIAEKVSPAAIFLVCKNAPNRQVLLAGAGVFSAIEIRESAGVFLPDGQCDADGVAEHFSDIVAMDNANIPLDGNAHLSKVLSMQKNN